VDLSHENIYRINPLVHTAGIVLAICDGYASVVPASLADSVAF